MSSGMSIDAWLAELTAAEFVQPEGFTGRDVRIALGITEDHAQSLLRRWHEAGKIEFAGYKTAQRIDGRSCRVPAYRRKRDCQSSAQ